MSKRSFDIRDWCFPVLSRKPFLIFLFLSAVGSIFYFWYLGQILGDIFIWQKLGPFGDFVNGVAGPIVGVFGIGLTLLVIDRQNHYQVDSSFVALFTQLFASLNEAATSIRITKGSRRFTGRKVFQILNKEFKAIYDAQKRKNPKDSEESLIQKAFGVIHADRSREFDYYFKLLYNILKLIDRKCPKQERELYAGILRSLLSKEEEIFLFYNGVGKPEFVKFKLLIEKYSMLHDLIDRDLHKQDHMGMYEDEAYD